MAKKKKPQQRTDADRRTRQAERLSRHLRVLHCILGRGRWDAEALAAELECSTRTVHRILQTLTLAGVPWYFCAESQCYRVRPGYRFPGMEDTPKARSTKSAGESSSDARHILAHSKALMESLAAFCDALERSLGS